MENEEKVRGSEEIATLMQIQYDIQNKIMEAINNPNASKEVTIGIDDTTVIIRLLDDEDGNYRMESDNNIVTGMVTVDKETKKVRSYRDVDVDFDQKRIHEILDRERNYERGIQKDIKKGTVDKNDSHALQMEVERGLKGGNALEMELDREHSESETMRMFIKRAWGISANKGFRVQEGSDPHNFKFVVRSSNGSYQELDLSSRREGRNTNQTIWLVENGQFKEKKVDSLLLNGRYGIATDLPEHVASQNTRSYLVTRTPNGQYFAIAAGEKRGVNRTLSGDELQKHQGARGRSVYELKDIMKAADTAEQIFAFNKDGKLTTREVEMVKEFKIDKNMDNDEVFEAVSLVVELKDMGYKCEEMKTILSARSKEEIIDLAKKVDEHFKDNSDSRADKTKKVDEDIEEDGPSIYDNPHGEGHIHTHKH